MTRQHGCAQDFSGIRLSRRTALAIGARMGGVFAALSAPPALLALGGCTPQKRSQHDYGPLVETLQSIVIPLTGTPGASSLDNASFVIRATDAGLMGVPTDTLAGLSDVLDRRAGGDFLSISAAAQIRIVAKLDSETFAEGAEPPLPWFATKALILMSYYTSEGGMSQELRYDLAPGHYEPDTIIDKNWRPLSNDWQGVAIRKRIVG